MAFTPAQIEALKSRGDTGLGLKSPANVADPGFVAPIVDLQSMGIGTKTEPLISTTVTPTETLAAPKPLVNTTTTVMDPTVTTPTETFKPTAPTPTAPLSPPPAPTPTETINPTVTAKTTEPTAPVTTYNLVDPLTGQTTSFDDKAKYDKASKLLDEQIAADKIDKEQRGIADDLITAAATFTKDMMAGNDPIKDAQWNYAIQKLGSNNQAYNAATMMKLKAAGIDPNAPGAGMAIMMQMARQSGMELSDVVNRLNVESADRIVEANKYGMTLASDIQSYRNTQRTSDWNYNLGQVEFLANTLKTEDPAAYDKALASMNLPVGVNKDQFIKDITSQNALDNAAAMRTLKADYDATRSPFNKLGIDIDTTLYAGLDGAKTSDIQDRLAGIQTSLSKGIGGKAEAKAKLLELQKLYPEIFKGDYSKWDPDDYDSLGAFNLKQNLRTQLATEIALAGTDTAALNNVVDKAVKDLIDPATAATEFDQMWSTMNADQKKAVIEMAGIDDSPLTIEEKIRALAADQVIGLQNNSNPMKVAYDNYYKQSSKEFKNWVTQPGNKEAFEQYLATIAKGDMTIRNPDGTLSIDTTKILEPTNVNSSLASLFYDWPVGLDTSGKWTDNINDWIFSGNTPKSDQNMADTPEGVTYQTNLDAAWKKYQMAQGEKSRMEWFKDGKPDSSGKLTKEVSLGTAESDKPDPAADFDKRMADLASGKITVADITPSEWALVTPDKMIPLEKAGIVKSIISEPTIGDINSQSAITQWIKENHVTASKDEHNNIVFKGSSNGYPGEVGAVTGRTYALGENKDPKDITDQQIIVLNGTPYALENWSSSLSETGSTPFTRSDVRSSILWAKNLKTGLIESIATG